MAQLHDKDFETVNAHLPKPLADGLKKHAEELGIRKNKARLLRTVIQRYLDSPDSRIVVLETQVKALRWEIDSLKRQIGDRLDK